MNDRHPSGSSTSQPSASGADYAHYATYEPPSLQHGGYGHEAYATGTFDTGTLSTGTFAADPLFGDMPGTEYDTGQWATTTATRQQAPAAYDAYAGQQPPAAYDTGSFDAVSPWPTGGYDQLADIPAQPGPDSSGQWDATAWNQGPSTGQWETQAFETQTFETGAFDTGTTDAPGTSDTGTFDATAWNTPDETPPAARDGHEGHNGHEANEAHEANGAHANSGAHDASHELIDAPHPYEPAEPEDPQAYELAEQYEIAADAPYTAAQPEPAPDGPAPGSRVAARGKNGGPGAGRSRARRRTPAKRSALFTVAVPSACVMGVAGVAAASVGSFGGDEGKETTASAPDSAPVKPSTANSKLDTQLANLSADAGDFADRASRTQERIDLKAEKVAAQKKAAAEAARKERLRPKFALPVKQHGLSAQYGQAGVNWMSAHSGIDFPVSYGTEVFAATDGTVTTKWNSAYGNMAIVTAKDGTETWYCHLSSHKISSGPVKAGETIAFSGNSGNSTGPHLHFEVRPSGGSAIDPLPWLRSHGLDPT
ncbi:peptidoglycan DD-metalloendopeptidase family protein [Streptomyces sp. G44]|uniref:peptidoglycan DD-metalloendopeptidase family protein n=1 Tax=Streptomyces sp. G44 TaxID=2807632 RepID=UPI0019602316|nr:peptidoglycan DD-metalloendopeptidase family protein [Streptomyces sp. G44]MBM7169674.1 peptidoglycan DD-metalloendopeptidase family protein [Streptomyces sp. G44]